MRFRVQRLLIALRGISVGVAVGTLVLTATVAVLIFEWPGNIVYWRSEESIEAYLRAQTPLGSTQTNVTQWLRARAIGAEIDEAVVEPNSRYPPTKIGGSSFIHAPIAHYGRIFRADIEAFYIFDTNRTLVDLRVRRTVDGL